MYRLAFLLITLAVLGVIVTSFQPLRLRQVARRQCNVGSSSSSSSSKSSSSDRKVSLKMMSSSAEVQPKPGSPVVIKVDKTTNIALLSVALTGEQTQRAFTQSCDLFNVEVKSRGYKAAGFRPGAKLPPAYLYQMFGEDRVKSLCGNLLSEEIQDECEKTGLFFVGRGRITKFNENIYEAGKPHVLEIECDLWPEITYGGENGYKGLKCVATKNAGDESKYEAVKKSIMERYKVMTPQAYEYKAQMGDVVSANMAGFERNPDGTKGAPLPAIAAGDKVDIPMEQGKFMEGMVEGLVGAKAGDVKSIKVKFPVRPSGPGAALSGKEALFEVTVLTVSIKSLPEWNAELANRVRENMTMAELEAEVRKALDGDAASSTETARNDALAVALLEITQVSRIPESLVDENTQTRFQNMLMDFKEQGSTDEQLAEMQTPENYKRYKDISRPNVNKVVTLGMAFRDIAEKEKISVAPQEIKEQLDLVNAQARQKGEQPPDARAASDEIENVLLRRKIFNFLASTAQISWVDAPTTGPDAK